jgi:hypothetical protein
MVYEEYYPIILGVLLLLAHYASDKIHVKHKTRLVSFSVGLSVTYIFLYLLPETINLGIPKIVFGSMLIGFALSRIVEIHAFHHKSLDLMKKELREIHSSMFFTYNFIIGMLILEFFKISLANALLFVVPLFLHAMVNSISINEIHSSIMNNKSVKLFLSASTLAGIIAAYFITISTPVFAAALGIVAGIFLYTVIRDSMPREKNANAWYFAFGIILYYLIIEMVLFLVS